MTSLKDDGSTAHPVVKTLGGGKYSLSPSRMDVLKPFWKKALMVGGMISFSPILVPLGMLYTGSMYFGPKWWRSFVHRSLITTVMGVTAQKFAPERKELFRAMKAGSKVLDLGCGAGDYFQHLKQVSQLVALEPATVLHDAIEKKAQQVGLQPHQWVLSDNNIEDYVKKHPEEMASFDWVILGNVLCEVDDQISTLECVDKLLKPGGYVYFSEHIGLPKGSWTRKFQDLVNPIWRIAGSGCNCNRDSVINIQNVRGWECIFWEFNAMTAVFGPFVLGLACKTGKKVN